MKTLINGACREDTRYESLIFQSLVIRRVICLKAWIKTSGEPMEHLVFEDYNNVCPDHYLDC